MEREPLHLHHREELSGKLNTICGRLSEFSFANLYLFRNVHGYELVRENDCVFITGTTNDKQKFVLPLCDHKHPDIDHLKEMIRRFGMLFPVSDCSLRYFDPREFDVYHNEDDSDYIYTVEKMATYSGRKLSKKRNLLKQFFSQYEHECLPASEETLPAMREILDGWQRDILLPIEETDYHAAAEAIDLIDALNLYGFVYLIGGVPAGYLLGEDLTSDTYVLHFAKGLTEYKGLYQFMYNDLARHLREKGCYLYLNFEQDLGIQSLRQAKSSYKPDHMGMKYRVTLKEKQ
ncbi:MAG: DUF2156 domain-containing protein [Spirochaetota bacterium]